MHVNNNAQLTMHNRQCTIDNPPSTIDTAQSTMHNRQCIINNRLSACNPQSTKVWRSTIINPQSTKHLFLTST